MKDSMFLSDRCIALAMDAVVFTLEFHTFCLNLEEEVNFTSYFIPIPSKDHRSKKISLPLYFTFWSKFAATIISEVFSI